MRFGTKIILIFVAIIVVVGGVVFFIAYQSRLASGVELEISSPDEVEVGVPFELKVNVGNSSQNILEDVRLSVNLPEGVAFLGFPATKNVEFKDLATIGVGGISQQTLELIVLSGENTFKQITAEASYLSGSLSSRFEREASHDLSVGDFGITLDIATPQQIFSGETFDIEISYKNDSEIDYNDLSLKIEYPLTFNLTKSTLPPDVGNNTWILGGLRKGSEMDFKITGNAIGPDGAFFDIPATIEAGFRGQKYSISTNAATVSIATSPLSLKIFLNEDDNYIAGTDEQLNYTLAYTNNTDIGLREVVITAQLLGEMFDFTTLGGKGIFRSLDNTLIWNGSNEPQLANLAPGQSGQINFFLRTRKNYPISRFGDKNFVLKVNGTIESPTVPHFVEANKTFSLANLETKIRGQADIDTKIYFRDASSGILNTGPFPPKVNKPTKYTVGRAHV